MPPAATPLPPAIPDYELLQLIGRGAYGDVWLARGITGAFRAVKCVWRDRFADRRPYEREFAGITHFAAVSLREPSQLALLHVGRGAHDEFFYYVMELADDVVQGRDLRPATYTPLTLKEHAAARRPLAAGEVVALGVELARAVASLHRAGLVHRDIKPSNIIFVGGVPKLADVGLVAAASSELTFVGTEGFVPPEGPGAPAADVFSLGKVLYELATGLDRQHWPRLPDDLATRPDRAALLELNEVLLRAGEGNAALRFPDATALLDELLLLQAGKSVRRLRRAERRLARALRVAAALALVAVVAGAGAYVERRRANEQTALRAQAEAERDALARRVVYSATIANVESALKRGEYGKARQLLGDLRPTGGNADLRGFEWHHLWAKAQGDPAFILQATGAAIKRLAVSPDGRWLAAHDAANDVSLFDLVSRRKVRQVANVRALAGFSSGSKSILGTDAAQHFAAWRIEDGSLERTLPRGSAYLLGLLPGDRVVGLSNGDPAHLVIWRVTDDVCTDLPLVTQEDGAAKAWEYFRGGLAEDGSGIALAWTRRDEGTAVFRSTWIDVGANGIEVVHQPCPERPSAVGVDNHGPWVAPTNGGPRWRIGRDGFAPENDFAVGRDVLRLLEIAPGEWLSCDREQLTWRNAAGAAVRAGRGHTGMIGDLAADRRARRFFSGSHAGEIREWLETTDGSAVGSRRTLSPGGNPTRIVFSPNSTWLAVPIERGQVAVLDVASGVEVRRIAAMRYPVWFTGAEVGGVASDGKGLILSAAPEARLLPAADGVLQVLASEDGRTCVATDSTGNLWLQHRGEAPRVLSRAGWQYRFALVADRRSERIWSADRNNRLSCVGLADGRERWSTELPALAPWVDCSPDGRWLAVPMENATLQLHDPGTGKLLRKLGLGGSTPQMVCFSADGRRLFVGGSKGDIVVLDTESWLQVAVLQMPTDEPIHQMAVAPDGRTLAALTKTGRLHLLRTQPD